MFDRPTPNEAVRLYRRISNSAWRRYDREALCYCKSKRKKHPWLLNHFKGADYTWRKCTKSGEGDPFQAPDSKSEYALRFPLENADRVTEIYFEFNDPNQVGQIAELEFDFS